MGSRRGTPAVRGPLQWAVVLPVLALVVLPATWVRHGHWLVLVLIAVFLVGAVLAAVHHAEVVAVRNAARGRVQSASTSPTARRWPRSA